MNAVSILKQWLQYAEYDPNQKTFNLLSLNYELHRCCEKISKITAYDPSCILAVLYAKHFFTKLLRECKITAHTVITKPDCLAEEMAMWRLFHSPEVLDLENELLNTFSNVIEKILPQKQLGERDLDAEREALFSSVEAVVEELPACNTELFRRGGVIQPVTNYATQIQVFSSLAECLLTLEQAQDGIHLCYIRVNDSLDGYFGFYLKSNGNILSINERIDEAYPGQHGCSRNGRYSEDKKYNLFPYSYIFSFSDHDYKGYAAKHCIDPEKLGLHNLTPNGYMPLVVAMLMISEKYSNTSTEGMNLHYADSLLPVNLADPLPGTQALVVAGNSMVAKAHEALSVNYTTDDIISAAPAHRLSHSEDTKGRDWNEYGIFPEDENIFVSLYAEGFELDASSLLESNPHIKRLGTAEKELSKATPHAEYVGSRVRMEIAAYKRGREQLAEYIRERMYEEYTVFGGTPAIIKWYEDALRANKERIFALCIERYNRPAGWSWKDAKDCGALIIHLETDVKDEPSPSGWRWESKYAPLNDYAKYQYNGNPDWGKGFKCCINTDHKASIYFCFDIESWRDIAKIVGEENLPKILKGYRREGHSGIGNNLLNATDAVWEIGTPFEDHEYNINRRYWTRHRWQDYYWSTQHMFSSDADKLIPPGTPQRESTCKFRFCIGFSKRGWAKVLKGDA